MCANLIFRQFAKTRQLHYNCIVQEPSRHRNTSALPPVKILSDVSRTGHACWFCAIFLRMCEFLLRLALSSSLWAWWRTLLKLRRLTVKVGFIHRESSNFRFFAEVTLLVSFLQSVKKKQRFPTFSGIDHGKMSWHWITRFDTLILRMLWLTLLLP